MSVEGLPSPGTKRRDMQRKARVVPGVRSGLISPEEACRRYRLSALGQSLIGEHGLPCLRVTYGKQYWNTGTRDNDAANPEPLRQATKTDDA